MSEDRILKAIADKVQDDRLHYQIIIQDDTVHIYINRDTEDYINYKELTENIHSAVAALNELDLIEMGLYSRILGEVEPDWQTLVELTQNITPVESSESTVDETSSVKNTDDLVAKVDREFETEEVKSETNDEQPVDIEESESSDVSEIKQELDEVTPDSEPPEAIAEIISEQTSGDQDPINLSKDETVADEKIELDLSQYCFIRNKRLLNADLVVPQEKIAQIVNSFHNFDESIKRSQLPILESYFKDGQDPDINDFAPEIKTWWTEIQELESNAKRNLAIWLSRYCLEPATTIATVGTVFEAKAAAKKAAEETAREKAREERKARNNFDNNSYSPSNSSKSSQNHTQSKQASQKSKSRPGSWITYILVVFVIRLIGRGFLNSFNPQIINEPVGINNEILTEYDQKTLDDAKKLADISMKKYNNRDFDAALKYTEEALKVFPDYSRAYYNRGTLKSKQQDIEGAIEDYTEAIETYPDNLSPGNILHQAYNNRGLLLRRLGYDLDAIDDASEAIALAPNDGGYHANRGLAYSGMRDYESALADQTRAIELEPNHPGWHFNRGRVYIHLGDYQKALVNLDRAIALNPFLARAFAFRCYTYEALGDFGKAVADRKKAESLGYKFKD